MVQYLRDESYMSFRRAVRGGMSYEDYQTLKGDRLIPVEDTQVKGFMKYILTYDVRWINLVSLDVLSLCLLKGSYSRELDDYLTLNGSVTINRVYGGSIEVRDTIDSIGGLKNLINQLRVNKGQGDIITLLKYKFILHHLEDLHIESESEMFALESLVKDIKRLYVKTLAREGRPDEVQQYTQLVDGLSQKLIQVQDVLDKKEELARYIESKRYDCQKCPLNTGDIITYTEQGIIYTSQIKHKGNKHVIQTEIKEGKHRILIDSEFCRHCGRHVDEEVIRK